MSSPIKLWLDTFMCGQYSPTIESWGYKTLQSVCQLTLQQLLSMGIMAEHCDTIMENIAMLQQSYMANSVPPQRASFNGPVDPVLTPASSALMSVAYHSQPQSPDNTMSHEPQACAGGNQYSTQLPYTFNNQQPSQQPQQHLQQHPQLHLPQQHSNNTYFSQQPRPTYRTMQQNYVSPERQNMRDSYQYAPQSFIKPDGMHPSSGPQTLMSPSHISQHNDSQNPQQVADDILQMASSQYMATGQSTVAGKYQHHEKMNFNTNSPNCQTLTGSRAHSMSSPDSQGVLSPPIQSPQSFSRASPYCNSQFSPNSTNVLESFNHEQFNPGVPSNNSSNQNVTNMIMPASCNPLMSLQKLSMLPEHQVIDPKTVVNEACLSGNDCEMESQKNSIDPEPVKCLPTLSSPEGCQRDYTSDGTHRMSEQATTQGNSEPIDDTSTKTECTGTEQQRYSSSPSMEDQQCSGSPHAVHVHKDEKDRNIKTYMNESSNESDDTEIDDSHSRETTTVSNNEDCDIGSDTLSCDNSPSSCKLSKEASETTTLTKPSSGKIVDCKTIITTEKATAKLKTPVNVKCDHDLKENIPVCPQPLVNIDGKKEVVKLVKVNTPLATVTDNITLKPQLVHVKSENEDVKSVFKTDSNDVGIVSEKRVKKKLDSIVQRLHANPYSGMPLSNRNYDITAAPVTSVMLDEPLDCTVKEKCKEHNHEHTCPNDNHRTNGSSDIDGKGSETKEKSENDDADMSDGERMPLQKEDLIPVHNNNGNCNEDIVGSDDNIKDAMPSDVSLPVTNEEKEDCVDSCIIVDSCSNSMCSVKSEPVLEKNDHGTGNGEEVGADKMDDIAVIDCVKQESNMIASVKGEPGVMPKVSKPVRRKRTMKATVKGDPEFEPFAKVRRSNTSSKLRGNNGVRKDVSVKKEKKDVKITNVDFKPVIRVVGTKDNPKSCSVVSNARDVDKSSKRSKPELDRPCAFASASDVAKMSPTDLWLCSICRKPANYKMLGDLFGPYYAQERGNVNDSMKATPNSRKRAQKNDNPDSLNKSVKRRRSKSQSASTETWVHEACAVWSSGVYMLAGNMHGLEDAVSAAQRTACRVCKSIGATLGCLIRGCTTRFHYHCAVESDCHMEEDNYSLLCSTHKKSKGAS